MHGVLCCHTTGVMWLYPTPRHYVHRGGVSSHFTCCEATKNTTIARSVHVMLQLPLPWEAQRKKSIIFRHHNVEGGRRWSAVLFCCTSLHLAEFWNWEEIKEFTYIWKVCEENLSVIVTYFTRNAYVWRLLLQVKN